MGGTDAWDLPALTTVSGDLTVSGLVAMPALTTVDGELWMNGSAAVDIPALTSVGALKAHRSSIPSISLGALESVGPLGVYLEPGLSLTDNAALVSVSMPALAEVDGPVRFEDNSVWCESDATALAAGIATVTGSITIWGSDPGC